MDRTVGAIDPRPRSDAWRAAAVKTGYGIRHWPYVGAIFNDALEPDRDLVGRLRCVIELAA